MYEGRLKELRIFNLNKDMVKTILDYVKNCDQMFFTS